MVRKLSKKVRFYKFVLTSTINLSFLKQFTYVDLKVLITLFQKMVWFIEVRATVHEISAMNQQKFNKLFEFQILISPEQ